MVQSVFFGPGKEITPGTPAKEIIPAKEITSEKETTPEKEITSEKENNPPRGIPKSTFMNKTLVNISLFIQTQMEGLSTPIGNDNIGKMLLQKMGWSEGGLGREGKGIEEPIQIHIKRDNRGIGANENTHYNENTNMSFIKSSQNGNVLYPVC